MEAGIRQPIDSDDDEIEKREAPLDATLAAAMLRSKRLAEKAKLRPEVRVLSAKQVLAALKSRGVSVKTPRDAKSFTSPAAVMAARLSDVLAKEAAEDASDGGDH